MWYGVSKEQTMQPEIKPWLKKSPETLFAERDEFEKLPSVVLLELSNRKFLKLKQRIKAMFVDNKIDMSAYPKIREAFDFDTI